MKSEMLRALLIFLMLIGGKSTGEAFAEVVNEEPYVSCDYLMCQYEKGNIDEIILGHAEESQTVMFGEIHDTVVADAPPPVEDSRYVISLLPALKRLGYRYLALEVTQAAPPETHSHDILKYIDRLKQGEIPPEEDYPYAKPGWPALVRSAHELGYRLIFINRSQAGMARDNAMYQALKADIFDHDPKAKVLVYIGANHICEKETTGGFSSRIARRKPLGYYLDSYTNGHNYSVYMGDAWDTPEGCDLMISHFIWDTFKKTPSTRVDVILPGPY